MDERRLRKQIKDDLLGIKIFSLSYLGAIILFLMGRDYYRALFLFIIYIVYLGYKIKKISQARAEIKIIKIFEEIILEEVTKKD